MIDVLTYSQQVSLLKENTLLVYIKTASYAALKALGASKKFSDWQCNSFLSTIVTDQCLHLDGPTVHAAEHLHLYSVIQKDGLNFVCLLFSKLYMVSM